jgi:very-short-patch-repair endonuclease
MKYFHKKKKKQKRPFMHKFARYNQANANIHERVLFAWLQERDPKWEAQHIWGYSIMDNWHPEHRVCIEVDGPYHNSTHRQKKDQIRDEAMRMAKIRVIRVTNQEVDSGLAYCKISEIMGYEWKVEDFYRPIWSNGSDIV